MTDLPTVMQIDSARTPLETAVATGVAAFYLEPYAPKERVDAFRRLYMNNLRDAVRALGFDLIERGRPHVVVNNDDQVTGMSR